MSDRDLPIMMRLHGAVGTLHWSAAIIATQLGCDPRRVRRWLSGAIIVPIEVLVWLERLSAFHKDNRPPRFKGFRESD